MVSDAYVELLNLVCHEGLQPRLRLFLKGFIQMRYKKFGEPAKFLGSTVGMIKRPLTLEHLVAR